MTDVSQILHAIQQLQQDNAALHQANNDLHQTMTSMQATMKTSLVNPALVTPQVHRQTPKVALPDKFDGTRSKYRGFINQLRLVFQLQPDRYPDGRTQVGLLGTLLTGPALSWFAPLLEQNSPLLDDLDAFLEDFEPAFGDSDKARTAANKIRSLTQGNRPASTYASEFRLLACDLTWGESALIDQFHEHLRSDVKDLLLTMKDPVTLNEAITNAIRCDNRLFERRRERHMELPSSYSRPPQVSAPPNSTTTEDPMQLDAIRPRTLTASEKERRRANNLCLYCGGSGHFAQSCPSKRHPPGRLSNLSPSSGNDVVQSL
jgi:hypothetical protein